MRAPAVVLLAVSLCAAYQVPSGKQTAGSQSREQADLDSALAEAGSSPVEFLRAIEKHLQKYPNSPQRAELERAAVRAAIEAKDDRRTILYGEHVLARGSKDPRILDSVTRALLAGGSRDDFTRALEYARRYESTIQEARRSAPPGVNAADWQTEVDKGLGRALCEQASATGGLGHPQEALALAQRAFDAYPNAESAREMARWDEKLGKTEDAIRHLADAFTIADPQNTDARRAADRLHMGDLYRRWKGSEAGLGDLVLAAFDRNSALLHLRDLRLRRVDPNAQLTDPMQFTLSGLDGQKLNMASLKGKTVVFDFWATWCAPCREQHPLYGVVRQRFRDNPNVVFLSINTDSDREPVRSFVQSQKWQDRVYFEDGLSRALNVRSIPTTIIIDRRGHMAGRMDGFVPGRFTDMLTERIRDALAD